jgi:hypothetical protein
MSVGDSSIGLRTVEYTGVRLPTNERPRRTFVRIYPSRRSMYLQREENLAKNTTATTTVVQSHWKKKTGFNHPDTIIDRETIVDVLRVKTWTIILVVEVVPVVHQVRRVLQQPKIAQYV